MSSTSYKARPPIPKYQYYQSDAVMTISILEPHVTEEALRVETTADTIQVWWRSSQNGVEVRVLGGTLYDGIVQDKTKIKYLAEKVLIKLRKVRAYEWNELFGLGLQDEKAKEAANEGDAKDATLSEKEAAPTTTTTTTPTASSNASPTPLPTQPSGTPATPATATPTPPSAPAASSTTRPYASSRDWNAIERELVAQEEAEDKPEGDEALHKLFRDIYGKADEDTRRAMIKSYQTSGGTVLSTNWNEVSEKNYEEEDRTVPDGMEWKTWEGKKVQAPAAASGKSSK